ncbi:MAG: MBL fold metallo-hydrolase [Planctomycetes bacterium]|nr:MBL fold metallo-hydrolase [Planctomycetota bacterium]
MAQNAFEIVNLHPDRQCRAYMIVDRARGEAALLDPRFDVVSAYMERLKREGLRLKLAIDSHTHADHLSGSDRLRNLTGCRIVMSSETRSHVPDHKIGDDQSMPLGGGELRFLHTPGHTPDSMCVLTDHTLLTGDTLFIGGSARTDFMGGSAASLFDSFRRIEALGPDVAILPGHDYNGCVSSTVAQELRANSAFAERDKDALVRRLSIKGELPLNMREMLAFNVDAGIREKSIVSPRDSILAGDVSEHFTVVDVRTDPEWSSAHIPGAVHIPLHEIETRIGELKGRRRPLLLTCKSGVRATLAFMAARLAGERDMLLLEGGMDGWAAAGRPMVADDGRKPVVIPMVQAGPSQACAAGGCAAPAPALAEVFAGSAHSWSDWVI